MIDNIILQVSNEFLLEGRNSPGLLADMASMEKYMAESYSERVFVELLQNADDACSKNVLLDYQAENIFFANDGRPFTEQDIISICRSGSSTKVRGTSIGYRGVGFKSTSYLSNEIIIYSNGTYFTFSKKRCAVQLNIKDLNNVPTIRIPFLIDKGDLDNKVVDYVDSLVHSGFSTVFIFLNSNLDYINEEIDEVNNGYFLFLNNITSATLKSGNSTKEFKINRNNHDAYSEVGISSTYIDKWFIYHSYNKKKVVISFKIDNNGKVTNCNNEEAVFHCYLPTLEKVGFPFKINADFSTDPSRKHLSFDNETKTSLEDASELLFKLLQNAIYDPNFRHPEIVELLIKKNSFSKFSMHLFNNLKEKMEKKKWVKLSSGATIQPSEYKLSPMWLENSEFEIIRTNSYHLKNMSLPISVYERANGIEQLLESFSQTRYDIIDFLETVKEPSFVVKINENLLGKLYGNIVKQVKLKSTVGNQKFMLSGCKLVINNSEYDLEMIKADQYPFISSTFKEAFCEVVNHNDAKWFDDTYSTNFSAFYQKESKPTLLNSLLSKEKVVSNSISKWRTAEQQCVELEQRFGNQAKDVSKQNLGYDVESRKLDGTLRYIEVKSISKSKDNFTMTNNEYSAAHQYGSSYYICLINQDDVKISAIYISDPVNTLKLEKRVRLWEFYCDEYSGEEFTVDLN